ncbi:tail fiber assembly protein [Chromobacterium vaccinii]|uniref:tail fiber assembly protein n=1 Tax=Chromobacterium vaccinii TaxID=1108595 RepID=UPI0032605E9F
MKQKTVYSYHPTTGEYIGTTYADRSPLDEVETWLIPAGATEVQPPRVGVKQVAVFNVDGWAVLPDWRGVPLWDVQTARPIIAAIGDTPDAIGATTLEPPQFAKWNGSAWTVDEAARNAAAALLAEQEVARRRAVADNAIVPLLDAVDLKIATPFEADLFAAWRRYRVELSRVPKQRGFPHQVDWPALPATP